MDAVDVPPMQIVPQHSDWEMLKKTMKVVVLRVLLQHMPVFSECHVVQHLPHTFSKECAKKSNIHSLGTIKADPASLPGVVDIMSKLHELCPKKNNSFQHVICNGDGLSMERMVSAKHLAARSSSAATRMEGLVPSPQEFHKEGILMQVKLKETVLKCN